MNQQHTGSSLDKKKLMRAWWSTIRPESLPVSIVPVVIGTILGAADHTFNWPLFVAMLVASVLIHLGANIVNEYFDFKRGIDDEASVGIGGAFVRGDVNPRAAPRVAIVFFVIALLLGVYISIASSWWVALIGGISMVIGYLYTGDPYPIAYTPFGELFSGVFMGSVIIGISYFIQTMTLTMDVVLISIPVTLFVASIMLTNNIRDVDGDEANGRRTLAIVLGRQKAMYVLSGLLIGAYVLTAVYIIAGILPLISLFVFLSMPKAYDVIKNIRGKTEAREMMPAMAAIGQTHAMYGTLLALTLLIHLLI